jgi:hypothetical protein
MVTLNPAPNKSSVLKGVQATFSATLSGGNILTLTVTNTAGYRFLDSSTYPYDSLGYYENIPVTTTCGINGATIDIKFGVVTETISTAPNGSTTLPCDNGTTSAATASTDHGTGLKVFCTAHAPLVSFGADNQAAQEKVLDFELQMETAHTPICVNYTGFFMSAAIPVASHYVNRGCFKFNAMIQSGFFIIPGTGGRGYDMFPIVDANRNGSNGPTQVEITDPNGANHAGTYLENPTCYGLATSSTIDNCITFYGPAQWFFILNPTGFNIRGHLIGEGVNTDTNSKGGLQEGTILNARAERVGNTVGDIAGGFNTLTPAIAIDGLGTASSNNVTVIRYRAFQNNGPSLAMRPCSSGDAVHGITIIAPKIESSGMENSPNANDDMQIGETADACNKTEFAKSDGSIFTTSLGVGAGVSGIAIVAPSITNPPVGTMGIHIKGEETSTSPPTFNVSQVRISQLDIGSAGINNGGGIEWDASQAGNVLDIEEDSTTDYGLVVNGNNYNSKSLEADCHDVCGALIPYVDTGLDVMTPMLCVLNNTAPPRNCTSSDGDIVDQNSTQSVANKTIDCAVNTCTNLPTGAVVQSTPAGPTAPTATSFTMAGLGGSITPTKSGKIQITISGVIIDSGGSLLANVGLACQISHGTGAAPLSNAGLTGTQDGTQQKYTAATPPTAAANVNVPFSITAVVTGLTINTSYWIDLAQKALVLTSQYQVSNVSISAIEL